MKHTQLFESFLYEGKSFQFSFDYNTDEDDVEYIQNILMDAGVDAIAEPGTFDDEMIVKAPNAVELRKAKKAIQADGFEINESFIGESSIGDIHIMAQEADSFTGFRKAFMDEYGKPKSVKELKSLEAWLQTIWNENQTNENNMKYTTTFEGFVNESKKEKVAGATYWEQVTIPNIGSDNTVKANNDSTKAAQALVDFWEKGKSPEAAGFTVRDMASLDVSKAKTGDIVTCKFIDVKTDKDYTIKMELRDTKLGVPNKNLYTWVSRV